MFDNLNIVLKYYDLLKFNKIFKKLKIYFDQLIKFIRNLILRILK